MNYKQLMKLTKDLQNTDTFDDYFKLNDGGMKFIDADFSEDPVFNESINAYATMLGNTYVIRISRLLAKVLTEQQLQAVLAHEISHLADRDFDHLGKNGVIHNILVFISAAIFTVVCTLLLGKIGLISGLFVLPIGLYWASKQHLAQSRKMELKSDHFAAMATSPEAMLQVLEILGKNQGNLGGFLAEFSSSHPLIKTRVEALQKLRK